MNVFKTKIVKCNRKYLAEKDEESANSEDFLFNDFHSTRLKVLHATDLSKVLEILLKIYLKKRYDEYITFLCKRI